LLNVSGNFVQDSAGTLSIELDGISPLHYDRLNIVSGTAALGGTLAVSLLPGFTPKSGNSFQILTADEGRSGTFASEILPLLGGGLFFDVLYDTNAVTLAVAGIPGDHNQNGIVDAADFTVWRDTLGRHGIGLPADGNGDGYVDNWDYGVWKDNFGATSPGSGAATGQAGASGSVGENAAVPEPASGVLVVIAGLCGTLAAARRSATLRGGARK
jgi:hypothetical protein